MSIDEKGGAAQRSMVGHRVPCAALNFGYSILAPPSSPEDIAWTSETIRLSR